MNHSQIAILRAGYHRSRNAYPEWTSAELAVRANLGKTCTAHHLHELETAGLVKAARLFKHGTTILGWIVTPAGQAALAAMPEPVVLRGAP
jgi:DNA-binding IclR family transcriptional regulator